MSSTKTVGVRAVMGAGQKVVGTARGHSMVIDQPVAGGGTDEGPTPLETLMFALGGCVCAISRIVAFQRKIELRGVDVDVQGPIDTSGLLGRPTESRVGFQSFEAIVRLDCDLSREEQEAFLHDVDARCPVSENLGHESTVRVTLA